MKRLLLMAALFSLPALAQQNICLASCGPDYSYSFITCYQLNGYDCPRHSGCFDRMFVTVVCESHYTGQYCGGVTGACCPGPCDVKKGRTSATDGMNGDTSCLFDPKKDDVNKLKVLDVFHDMEVKDGKITRMGYSIEDEIRVLKLHIVDSLAATY